MKDKLLTTKGVAFYLKIKETSVQAMARQKLIPAIRLGRLYRYRQTDIEQWISEKESGAEEKHNNGYRNAVVR